jgi:hypothetical protein
MSSNSPQLQLARLALAALPPGDLAKLISEYSAKREQIVSRADVASRFNRSPRAIDMWAERGLLRKVKLPGSSRAVGFRLSEVEALLREGGRA